MACYITYRLYLMLNKLCLRLRLSLSLSLSLSLAKGGFCMLPIYFWNIHLTTRKPFNPLDSYNVSGGILLLKGWVWKAQDLMRHVILEMEAILGKWCHPLAYAKSKITMCVSHCMYYRQITACHLPVCSLSRRCGLFRWFGFRCLETNVSDI